MQHLVRDRRLPHPLRGAGTAAGAAGGAAAAGAVLVVSGRALSYG